MNPFSRGASAHSSLRFVLSPALLPALGALFALGGPTGCSSSPPGPGSGASGDVQTVCAKLVSCGAPDSTGAPYTQSSCESDLAAWVPPAGCAEAANDSTCASINGGQASAFASACFPSCSGGTNACNGDTLTSCRGGTTLTVDCAKECAQGGETYTGVCGASYKGQVTPSGQQECWCGSGAATTAGSGSGTGASGGGSSIAACLTRGGGTCVACASVSCATELSNVESACRAYLQCVCASGTFDAAAASGCASNIDSACDAAVSALQSCDARDCAASCVVDGGG